MGISYLSSKMLQLLQFTLFSILFNKVLGEIQIKGLHAPENQKTTTKYTPEIYDISESGLKYRIRNKEIRNSCTERAYGEQEITYHYILSIIDGEKIIEIRRTKAFSPTTNILDIHDRMPAGKLNN